MRVIFVPVKGNTYFWHLSATDLGFVRDMLVDRYPGAERLLFDGIRGILCDDGPLLSVDADWDDTVKLASLDSASQVVETYPMFNHDQAPFDDYLLGLPIDPMPGPGDQI